MRPPVAVITGGEGDLAQAIQAELAQQGWNVRAPGRTILDVSDSTQVKAFFADLDHLDLLIHNAGLCRDASILKMSVEDFDTVLDVNLRGAFLCSQAALIKMAKQKAGHILHIGSFSALTGNAGQANYAASKAALIGLTQSIAKEYGPRNVRANCILPGFLETKMTHHLLADEQAKASILEAHALGRLNSPQDTARFIAFLHTMMPHVSGQVFQLDSRIRRWT